MMGQQTIGPADLNNSSVNEHEHLSAADIVAMLHGLTAEQQNEFYQAIGLEHEQEFYNMLGLCPSTNDSLHSQPVCDSFIVLLYLCKGRYSSSWGDPQLRATGRHLPYGITQCCLPPDTSERAPPNPSHAGWYSICLPRRDGRLS